MKCAFCKYGPNDADRLAEFIIDGQAVCEDHVDDADGEFGPALDTLWREWRKGHGG